MLTQYKKEEEQAFKDKFDQLILIQENRAKIKETLNNVRNNMSSLEDMRSQSAMHPHKLTRIESQPALSLDKLLKSKETINRVLDQ